MTLAQTAMPKMGKIAQLAIPLAQNATELRKLTALTASTA